jgi:hypothetical protein
MEKRDCTSMSNNELKIYIESLKNIFESKKNEVIRICEEMDKVELEFLNATNELKIRKNIHL